MEKDKESFLKVVDDISYWPDVTKNNKLMYIIGSKQIDRYFKISEDQVEDIFTGIKLMDGSNSLEWIEEYLRMEKRIDVDIHALYNKLASIGLIEGKQAANTSSEISVMGVDMLKLSFPEISKKFANIVRVLWKVVLGLSIISLIGAIIGVPMNSGKMEVFFDEIFIYRDSYLLGVVVSSIVSLFALLLHELAHWATAIRYGLQPSEIHFTLYGGVLPMWYVKIRGMYTVPVKTRVKIMGAGIYLNITLMTLAISLSAWGNLSEYGMQIMSKVVITSFLMVISNMSPLRLSDGYYIISQLTKTANLRIRILKALGGIFNGKREKINLTLISYFLVSMIFMAIGIFNTLTWAFKLFYELSAKVSIIWLKYIIIIIPFAISTVTIFLFVRSFIRFSKDLNGSNQQV